MTCNKACFESKEAVKHDIAEKSKTYPCAGTLRAYLCNLCGNWHSSKLSKSELRIRRKQKRKRDKQIKDIKDDNNSI